jgi:hypothetical protein
MLSCATRAIFFVVWSLDSPSSAILRCASFMTSMTPAGHQPRRYGGRRTSGLVSLLEADRAAPAEKTAVLVDLAEQLGVLARLGYDEVEQTGRPLEGPPLVVQLVLVWGRTNSCTRASRYR